MSGQPYNEFTDHDKETLPKVISMLSHYGSTPLKTGIEYIKYALTKEDRDLSENDHSWEGHKIRNVPDLFLKDKYTCIEVLGSRTKSIEAAKGILHSIGFYGRTILTNGNKAFIFGSPQTPRELTNNIKIKYKEGNIYCEQDIREINITVEFIKVLKDNWTKASNDMYIDIYMNDPKLPTLKEILDYLYH